MQCILDGVVLRHRVQPGLMTDGDRWNSADLMADTVIALLAGVIDFDESGVTSRAAVDARAGRGDRR